MDGHTFARFSYITFNKSASTCSRVVPLVLTHGLREHKSSRTENTKKECVLKLLYWWTVNFDS
jgi:hypothetical protein